MVRRNVDSASRPRSSHGTQHVAIMLQGKRFIDADHLLNRAGLLRVSSEVKIRRGPDSGADSYEGQGSKGRGRWCRGMLGEILRDENHRGNKDRCRQRKTGLKAVMVGERTKDER